MKSSSSLIRARGLGKRYAWPSHAAEYATLSDRLGQWITSPWKTLRSMGVSARSGFGLCAMSTSTYKPVKLWRSSAQRERQEHAAQDPVQDYTSYDRQRFHARSR